MKDLVQRLKIYIEHKEIGIIDLSVILKYNSPQKLYRLFNTRNASPSCQIIEDIATKFEELNLNWLFTGKGNMLNAPAVDEDYKARFYQCLEEKEKLYKKIIGD